MAATPTAAKPANLYEKLLAIRSAFGPIEKTGQPKTGPSFKFVEARVLAGKFVEAIGEMGIVMLPVKTTVADMRLSGSEKQNVITVHTVWRIQDVVSGEFVDVESIGQGADNSDKAAPKAQTNALKYAILLVLQAAGEDPETDSGANDDVAAKAQAATAARRAAAAPVVATQTPADAEITAPAVSRTAPLATDALKKKIRATGRELGLGDLNLKALAYSVAGKESSKDWTMADADQILAALDVPATVAVFASLELAAAQA